MRSPSTSSRQIRQDDAVVFVKDDCKSVFPPDLASNGVVLSEDSVDVIEPPRRLVKQIPPTPQKPKTMDLLLSLQALKMANPTAYGTLVSNADTLGQKISVVMESAKKRLQEETGITRSPSKSNSPKITSEDQSKKVQQNSSGHLQETRDEPPQDDSTDREVVTSLSASSYSYAEKTFLSIFAKKRDESNLARQSSIASTLRREVIESPRRLDMTYTGRDKKKNVEEYNEVIVKVPPVVKTASSITRVDPTHVNLSSPDKSVAVIDAKVPDPTVGLSVGLGPTSSIEKYRRGPVDKKVETAQVSDRNATDSLKQDELKAKHETNDMINELNPNSISVVPGVDTLAVEKPKVDGEIDLGVVAVKDLPAKLHEAITSTPNKQDCRRNSIKSQSDVLASKSVSSMRSARHSQTSAIENIKGVGSNSSFTTSRSKLSDCHQSKCSITSQQPDINIKESFGVSLSKKLSVTSLRSRTKTNTIAEEISNTVLTPTSFVTESLSKDVKYGSLGVRCEGSELQKSFSLDTKAPAEVIIPSSPKRTLDKKVEPVTSKTKNLTPSTNIPAHDDGLDQSILSPQYQFSFHSGIESPVSSQSFIDTKSVTGLRSAKGSGSQERLSAFENLATPSLKSTSPQPEVKRAKSSLSIIAFAEKPFLEMTQSGFKDSTIDERSHSLKVRRNIHDEVHLINDDNKKLEVNKNDVEKPENVHMAIDDLVQQVPSVGDSLGAESEIETKADQDDCMSTKTGGKSKTKLKYINPIKIAKLARLVAGRKSHSPGRGVGSNLDPSKNIGNRVQDKAQFGTDLPIKTDMKGCRTESPSFLDTAPPLEVALEESKHERPAVAQTVKASDVGNEHYKENHINVESPRQIVHDMSDHNPNTSKATTTDVIKTTSTFASGAKSDDNKGQKVETLNENVTSNDKDFLDKKLSMKRAPVEIGKFKESVNRKSASSHVSSSKGALDKIDLVVIDNPTNILHEFATLIEKSPRLTVGVAEDTSEKFTVIDGGIDQFEVIEIEPPIQVSIANNTPKTQDDSNVVHSTFDDCEKDVNLNHESYSIFSKPTEVSMHPTFNSIEIEKNITLEVEAQRESFHMHQPENVPLTHTPKISEYTVEKRNELNVTESNLPRLESLPVHKKKFGIVKRFLSRTMGTLGHGKDRMKSNVSTQPAIILKSASEDKTASIEDAESTTKVSSPNSFESVIVPGSKSIQNVEESKTRPIDIVLFENGMSTVGRVKPVIDEENRVESKLLANRSLLLNASLLSADNSEMVISQQQSVMTLRTKLCVEEVEHQKQATSPVLRSGGEHKWQESNAVSSPTVSKELQPHVQLKAVQEEANTRKKESDKKTSVSNVESSSKSPIAGVGATQPISNTITKNINSKSHNKETIERNDKVKGQEHKINDLRHDKEKDEREARVKDKHIVQVNDNKLKENDQAKAKVVRDTKVKENREGKGKYGQEEKLLDLKYGTAQEVRYSKSKGNEIRHGQEGKDKIAGKNREPNEKNVKLQEASIETKNISSSKGTKIDSSRKEHHESKRLPAANHTSPSKKEVKTDKELRSYLNVPVIVTTDDQGNTSSLRGKPEVIGDKRKKETEKSASKKAYQHTNQETKNHHSSKKTEKSVSDVGPKIMETYIADQKIELGHGEEKAHSKNDTVNVKQRSQSTGKINGDKRRLRDAFVNKKTGDRERKPVKLTKQSVDHAPKNVPHHISTILHPSAETKSKVESLSEQRDTFDEEKKFQFSFDDDGSTLRIVGKLEREVDASTLSLVSTMDTSKKLKDRLLRLGVNNKRIKQDVSHSIVSVDVRKVDDNHYSYNDSFHEEREFFGAASLQEKMRVDATSDEDIESKDDSIDEEDENGMEPGVTNSFVQELLSPRERLCVAEVARDAGLSKTQNYHTNRRDKRDDESIGKVGVPKVISSHIAADDVSEATSPSYLVDIVSPLHNEGNITHFGQSKVTNSKLNSRRKSVPAKFSVNDDSLSIQASRISRTSSTHFSKMSGRTGKTKTSSVKAMRNGHGMRRDDDISQTASRMSKAMSATRQPKSKVSNDDVSLSHSLRSIQQSYEDDEDPYKGVDDGSSNWGKGWNLGTNWLW